MARMLPKDSRNTPRQLWNDIPNLKSIPEVPQSSSRDSKDGPSGYQKNTSDLRFLEGSKKAPTGLRVTQGSFGTIVQKFEATPK